MTTTGLALNLQQSYIQQNQAIRDKVRQFAQGQFSVSNSWRTADKERFLKEVVPIVQAGRQQVSQMTAAYMGTLISDATGKRVVGAAIDTSLIRGVDAAEVYARPFESVWTSLSNGATLDSAVAAGMARLNTLINTDMQLSKTLTAQDVLTSKAGNKVIGYERILGGDQSCALCIVASTQRYHRGDLMPIHNNCNCDVGPIIDTGEQVIYPERLQAAHDAVQEATGSYDSAARSPDYRQIMVQHTQGELGPVIAFKGVPFVGPNNLTAVADKVATDSAKAEHVAQSLGHKSYADFYAKLVNDAPSVEKADESAAKIIANFVEPKPGEKAVVNPGLDKTPIKTKTSSEPIKVSSKTVKVGTDTPVPVEVGQILDKWVQQGGSFSLTSAERDAVGNAITSHGEVYKGSLYRGESNDLTKKDLLEKFKVGKTVDFKASSFTTNFGDALPYAENMSGGNTQVVYEISGTADNPLKVLNVESRAMKEAGFAENERITQGSFSVSKAPTFDSEGTAHVYLKSLQEAPPK